MSGIKIDLVVVYFSRLGGITQYWPDVLLTINSYNVGSFRNALMDVGLNFIVKKFGRVYYDSKFINKYIIVCKKFYKKFGRFLAIVPDYPPSWKGVVVHNYLEKHYMLLSKFIKFEEPFWVGVFRYEGLRISEIEKLVDKYGEIFDHFNVIAIPARNPIIETEQFIEAVKVVKKNFPNKKIHLLGPRMKILRVCYKGICDSLDFGEAVINIAELKRFFASAVKMNKEEWEKFRITRLSRKEYTLVYWTKIQRLIKLVEQYIGDVT